jgi:hypothetical protein
MSLRWGGVGISRGHDGNGRRPCGQHTRRHNETTIGSAQHNRLIEGGENAGGTLTRRGSSCRGACRVCVAARHGGEWLAEGWRVESVWRGGDSQSQEGHQGIERCAPEGGMCARLTDGADGDPMPR